MLLKEQGRILLQINIINSNPTIIWIATQEKSVMLLTWCSVIKHNPSPVLLPEQIFDDASVSSEEILNCINTVKDQRLLNRNKGLKLIKSKIS